MSQREVINKLTRLLRLIDTLPMQEIDWLLDGNIDYWLTGDMTISNLLRSLERINWE